jgi:hypothetical protein
VWFVIVVVRYVLLIVQRLRMTETVRQGQFSRRAIAQRIETEIEGVVVHGEFEIYHGTNVHPSCIGKRIATSLLPLAGPLGLFYPKPRELRKRQPIATPCSSCGRRLEGDDSFVHDSDERFCVLDPPHVRFDADNQLHFVGANHFAVLGHGRDALEGNYLDVVLRDAVLECSFEAVVEDLDGAVLPSFPDDERGVVGTWCSRGSTRPCRQLSPQLSNAPLSVRSVLGMVQRLRALLAGQVLALTLAALLLFRRVSLCEFLVVDEYCLVETM